MGVKYNWWNMKNWLKKGNELIAEIQNTVTENNQLSFWYIGQCGFIFKYAGKTLLIDGVLNDFSLNNGVSSLEYDLAFPPQAIKIDYILCTHGHADHFETKTLQGLQKANPEAKVFIPAGCKQQALENEITNLTLLEPGKSAIIDEQLQISVTPVSAAHPTHIYDYSSPQMCLCYNIHFGNINAVHLGDTYLTEQLFKDLTAIPSIDLFFPPINGDDYFRKRINFIGNMEAEEAAKLAACLKPALSIPTHYDMVNINTADPRRFINQLEKENKDLNYFVPELGERKIYTKR